MPELPEVERVRMALEARVVGRTIDRVRIVRRDVIATPRDPAGGFARNRSERSAARSAAPSRVTSADLLAGTHIERIERRGKRVALIAANGRALDVHLGMTGAVLVAPAKGPLPDHTHIVWTMGTTQSASERMIFRDPRRFGGVWTCPSAEHLYSVRWADLGPDALTIDACELRERLQGSRRGIKTALLDQSVLAGVGNIYADEALFDAGVHPEAPGHAMTSAQVDRLARAIREVLARAIVKGGSTIRDFAMPDGSPGSYQADHSVYGRSGLPCRRCAATLLRVTVAQRTTTFCPNCQVIGPHRIPTETGHTRHRTSKPFRKSSL